MNSTNLKITRNGEWKSDDILMSIARQPESERLFVGSSDFRVYEFGVSQDKPERIEFSGAGHESYVTGMTLIGEELITGSYDGQLIWWNLEQRQQIRSQPGHGRWIRQVIATPDQSKVISIGDDMRCKVWDSKSGELIADFSDHPEMTPHHYPSMLYAVAISANGKFIATGDRTGHVAIWNANTFEKQAELETPVMYTWDPKARRHSIGGIRSLAFSPDATQLAVGGIGKIGNIDHLGGPSRLEVFDWMSGDRLHEIEDTQKKGLIEEMIYRPDGVGLIGIGGDHKGFVNLYDLEQGTIASQAEASGHLHAAEMNEQATTIYTAGHNRIERWELMREESEPVQAAP